MTSESHYIFDEQIAARLRAIAVTLVGAIDELLARTRVEPVDPLATGATEMNFWEADAALRDALGGADESL